MNTGLIAARYAEALAEYALQMDAEAQVYADSVALLAEMKNLESEGPVTDDALTEAVQGCCKVMQRFLLVVVKNGRSSHLLYILNTFGRNYRWKHGIAKAHIVTANEAWQPVLKKQVEEFLYSHGWSNVEFRFDNDKSLIGGYLLQLRDQRVDASLASQLRLLSNELTEKNHQL